MDDDEFRARQAAAYFCTFLGLHPHEGIASVAGACASDQWRKVFAEAAARYAPPAPAAPPPPRPPPAPRDELAEALDVLGVTPQCTRDELARAYGQAAKAAHPDVGGSHEAMCAVNAAFACVKRSKGWA